MVRIIRDTTYRWKGPWLLENQDLIALDSAVSEAKAHVAAAQHEYDESRISAIAATAAGGRKPAESVEQYAHRLEEWEEKARGSYAIDPLETTIEFELAGAKKIRCRSISEGLANSAVIEGRTVFLSINLEAVRRRAALRFDLKNEEVCIDAYPAGDAHIEIAFSILTKWAASRQPSKYYRFWGRSPLNVLFLLPVVWPMVHEYRDVRRSPDALGLPTQIDWATIGLAATVLIVACVLLFGRPAAAIGIGDMRQVLTNRKRWISFWLAFVPLAVLACIAKVVLDGGVGQH